MRRLFIFTALLCLLPYAAWGQVATDFDGDGTSDITFLTASGSLDVRWQSDPSDDVGTALDEIFGLQTDSNVMAHWLGAENPAYLGVVRLRTESNKLAWKILLGGGKLQEELFGRGGDVYLSGGDFNGNGIADAAVARSSGGKLRWNIKSDLFGSPGGIRTARFGFAGDRVFYASPDGAHDWIGSFGLNHRRGRMQLRNLTTRRTMRVRGIPAALAKGTRPRPMPLQQDDGSDLIVFVVPDESDTTFHVYDLSGNLIAKTPISGLGVTIIGDFDPDDSGEEIAFQTSGKIRFYNPVSGAITERAAVAGVPVDEINVETIAPAATPTPSVTATPTATPTATFE